MQGPLTGISSGSSTSSHKDLYETLVWWRSSHITNLHGCTMKLLQDRRRRTFQRIHKISLPRKTAGNQLKSAPRHDESDPTRRRCREGCASDVKIRTWAGSIQCAAPATRNHHHHHHHRHHHVQNQKWWEFHKTRFSTLLRLPRKMTFKSTSHFDPRLQTV